MGVLLSELFLNILLLFDLFAILFELSLQIVNFTNKLSFFVISKGLVLLLKQELLLLFEHDDFLVILFFNFRDQFVLHVYLLFGHLL